ncbi:MFS transporter [Pseudonocardia acaciae]|uniref:MFS transporter n=1 Tax=Pseudonocardia acaciae TaxID=551276 RepID=UPI00048D2134|nr:MFS transporter [Pseudonocardia acaciae]
MKTTQTNPRAGRREWLGLAVLALPTLLQSLDISVLYLALPTLSADLGANGTQQLWILDSYGFMIAGFLVTMGSLGDRIGRRRLLLVGAAAFGVASVVAAFATGPVTLILARALLGLAAATLMPSTLALISTMFRDATQRGLAVAVWMSCFMAGTAIGPVVGGALLEHFWWGSAFLLGVPVMVLLLAVGPVLLPEHRSDGHSGRIDLASVALSLATVLPVVYGIKELARDGVAAVPVLAVVVGAGFGVAFVRRQNRLADPLLDLALFRRREFTAALAIGLVAGAVMGGTVLLVTQYLQQVLGLSPLHTGLVEVPQAVAMTIGSLTAARLAGRFGPAQVMAGGLVLAAAGLAVLAVAGQSGGVSVTVLGLVLTHAGLGPTMALTIGMVLGAAPERKAGAASALSETGGELGIAMGVAVLGSLGVALYRAQLAGGMPAGVPAEAADAARESLAAAQKVAPTLPGHLGADLLAAAQQAFGNGLTVTAGLGAALFVGLAVLTARRLRSVAPAGHEEPAEERELVAA